MKIEQLYTACLAQGAYYIESEGEVAIIDPLREVDTYLRKAETAGANIKYILETHFHADFVSGHRELAEKTGANIVFGPHADTNFPAHIATDGEVLKLGKISLEVLHTPGHTLESVCYLLKDENCQPQAIFTGDTLFIGDVGRPDLAAKSSLSKEDLARLLYHSLRDKIMPLPDEVLVYPAHGAGSACGKNMSKETFDRLGNQKKTNYALRADMTEEEFVQEVSSGLLPPPRYFAGNVRLNKEGAQTLDQVMKQAARPLSPAAFEAAAKESLILDTRAPQTFAKGFIPNSLNIGIDGQFAPWVGALIADLNQPILLVAEEGRAEEAAVRLARVGYDNTLGYLEGGFAAWQAAGKVSQTLESISAEELAQRMKADEKLQVVDVRKPGEYESSHIENVPNTPLDFLTERLSEIPQSGDVYIHCAGGYRSMIACSLLKARGWGNVIDVAGGYNAIKKTDIPLTDFVCASSLK